MKNVIKKTFESLVKRIERGRSAKEILMLSDRQLNDIGLSRSKLEQGANAYPWKIETSAALMGSLATVHASCIAFETKAVNDSTDHSNHPKAA